MATGSMISIAQAQQAQDNATTFEPEEISAAGHKFFGETTAGVAEVIEYTFHKLGKPTAYIVGEEGSGAFVGGLRYGEGTLIFKDQRPAQKVFWQGPSIGFDFGGNGSRVMVLVYNINSADQLFDRYPGVDGSAYVVGGIGVNFQKIDDRTLAPIRTGVGLRMGVNAGYLKYTPEPTWNPF
jgi:hypothetical protein